MTMDVSCYDSGFSIARISILEVRVYGLGLGAFVSVVVMKFNGV